MMTSPDVDIIQNFFETLKAKIAPVDIPTDEEGFILHGALYAVVFRWGIKVEVEK